MHFMLDPVHHDAEETPLPVLRGASVRLLLVQENHAGEERAQPNLRLVLQPHFCAKRICIADTVAGDETGGKSEGTAGQ